MAGRNTLVLGAVVAVIAFLVGFVPQYQQARALRGDFQMAREQIRALEWQMKLAEFRDAAGMVYLTTNQQNFGIALQHSTQFFDRAAELSREAPDSGLKAFLATVLQRRDEITAGLARGNGATRDAIEQLYIQVVEQIRQ